MKYFTLSEFTRSHVADERGLNNTPSELHKKHIEELVNTLLDPLREAWAAECEQHQMGTPAIRVSSGYRSPHLNSAVAGSSSSAHCVGWAADLVPLNGRLLEFKRFARKWLTENRVFDQLISEYEDNNGVPKWLHVGLKNRNGRQRKELLSKPLWAKGGYIQMTE